MSKYADKEKMLRVYTHAALRTDGGLFYSVSPQSTHKLVRSPCSQKSRSRLLTNPHELPLNLFKHQMKQECAVAEASKVNLQPRISVVAMDEIRIGEEDKAKKRRQAAGIEEEAPPPVFAEGAWRKAPSKRFDNFKFTKRIKHNEVMMAYEKKNRVNYHKVARLMDRVKDYKHEK